jgi:hypothetical protein
MYERSDGGVAFLIKAAFAFHSIERLSSIRNFVSPDSNKATGSPL